MTKAGLLIRESRGLYWLAEQPPPIHPDLVALALRAPKAVVCLISALAFHGLTTQIPSRVYAALPRGARRPKIEYPPVRFVWLSPVPYTAGLQVYDTDGFSIRVYDREKTVADCFKFRHLVGYDVALEALKDYLGEPGPDVTRLLDYAKINRVDRMMIPLIQSMLQ
jgi:predicted transcriptional regulator of viral defense system